MNETPSTDGPGGGKSRIRQLGCPGKPPHRQDPARTVLQSDQPSRAALRRTREHQPVRHRPQRPCPRKPGRLAVQFRRRPTGQSEHRTRPAGRAVPAEPDGQPLGDAERLAFDDIVRSLDGNETIDLAYDLPLPKWQFLHLLTARHGFLLHGSGVSLTELEPRPQDDWTGRPVEAVFATSDPIWAIFFATIDRKASGNIRNGGLRIRTPDAGDERYYFFSVAGAEGDEIGRASGRERR